MSGIVDTAYVEILPDLKKFDREAERQVKAALADAGKEADKAAAEIEEALTEALKSSGRQATKTLDGIQREIREVNGKITVKMIVDDREITRTLKRGIDGKIRENKGELFSAGSLIGEMLSGSGSGGGGILGGLTKGLGSLGGTLSSAISTSGPYVQAAAMTMAGTAAAAVAPAVAALGLALPAAAGVGAGAIATLTLGFQGLGDAIKDTGDPEKFAEDLEKLSPAAQRFALEIKNLLPLLRSIKNAAQEGIFRGFEGELTEVVTTLQGPLRAGLDDVGRAINDVLFGLAGFAVSAEGVKGINAIFSATADIIRAFAPAFNPFLSGITDLVIKALPFVEKLSKAFANFLDDLGLKLSGIASDGTLTEIFGKGLEILSRLWDVGKEVWHVFEGLFAAALKGGGPALDAMTTIAEAIGEIFTDKENIQAFVVIFQALGYAMQFVALEIKLTAKIFSLLIDGITWLVRAVIKLGKAFPDFARSVGDAISDAWDAVSGFVSGLFSDIGSAIADFASSVGNWFADAWDTVTTGIVDAFNAVITFFKELPGKILDVLKAIPGLVLGALGMALKAALQAIGVAIGLILFAVLELPKRIPGYLAQLWEVISTFFVNLWNSVYNWTVTAWNSLLAWLAALPGRIGAAISSLWSLLSTFFVNLWNSVSSWTVNAWNSMIAWFQALPGRIVAAIISLSIMMAAFFTQLWNDVRTWAINGWNSILDWIRSVPGRIMNLISTFQNAGLSLIKGFFSGLSSASGFADNIGNAVWGAVKSSLNWAIRQINTGIAHVDDILPGSIPRIPLLAKGGIALGPAMVGEAGQELALPLQGQRGRRAMQMFAEAAQDADSAPGADGAPGVRTWGAPLPVEATLVIESSGTRMDDLLIEILSKAIRVRGGVVQKVIGNPALGGVT